MSSVERKYDIVLFGATGYTGLYAAEHIVSTFPTNLSWALAGRNNEKLLCTAKNIRGINRDRKEPGIEIAQLDASQLTTLAKKTKCIINTVGPYCKYGEPVVKACAENGTHYLDATGEAPWVKDMVTKYHASAKNTGAIIIPESGLESVPADLITFAVAKYVREIFKTTTKEVILTTHSVKMSFSGGTLATIMAVFDVYGLSDLFKSGTPEATCPIALPKHTSKPVSQQITGIRSDMSDLGTLSTSIQATSDLPIVYRSWGLLTEAGDSYGPDFRFSPHMTVRNAFLGTLLHLALTFGPVFLALWPVRWLMAKMVYAPGDGPTREEAQNHGAEWRAIGIPDGSSRRRAFAKCRWQGSAYLLTGITLAEGARTILTDDTMAKKIGGGVLTTATLGQPYIDHLAAAGLVIELKTLEG